MSRARFASNFFRLALREKVWIYVSLQVALNFRLKIEEEGR